MCNFLKPDESWWGLLKLMIHQPCFFLHRESCIIWGFKYLIWRYLIRLFRGWGFPYIRLTYCLDRLFYLHLIIGWITWRYPPIFYGCISFKATSLIYKKKQSWIRSSTWPHCFSAAWAFLASFPEMYDMQYYIIYQHTSQCLVGDHWCVMWL